MELFGYDIPWLTYIILAFIIVFILCVTLRLIFGKVERKKRVKKIYDNDDLRRSIRSTSTYKSYRSTNDKYSIRSGSSTISVESLSSTLTDNDIEDFYKGEPIKNNKKCSKGEAICRKVLSERYGLPFETYRPNFLKNPDTGFNLELDCYEWKLKIACEYQGKQHYVYTPFFHKTKEDFEIMKENDKLKVAICEKIGVFLIRVPYTISFDKIPSYINDILDNLKKKTGKDYID